MSRGLLTAISGFIPVLLAILLPNSIDRQTGMFLAGLALFSMSALFMLGTTLIAVDKGHSVGTGLLLGIISPLGTVIAVLLSDKKQLPADEQPLKRPRENNADDRAASGGFQFVIAIVDLVFWPSVICVGLFFGVVFSWVLLSYKGGIPAGKLVFGISGGATYAAATAGMMVFWPLAFAPQRWLLKTRRGRAWLARTGLRNQESTIAFRIMSFIIATFATAFYVPLVMAVVEAITKVKPGKA